MAVNCSPYLVLFCHSRLGFLRGGQDRGSVSCTRGSALAICEVRLLMDSEAARDAGLSPPSLVRVGGHNELQTTTIYSHS
jgi:hypothetical protein